MCYRAIVPAPTHRRLLPGLTVSDGFMRHPFDATNGVRTSGLVAGRHLKSGHRHDRHATAYYGVAPSVFRALVNRWRRTKPVASIGDFTFIDIGAGMGRAVLLASEMPFHRVVGVELHPTLAGIARRNLQRWRAIGRVDAPTRIHCSDAVEFPFPAGPCLLFLFNPFGKAVMRRLLQHIAHNFADRPGQLDLLYANNEQEGELERHRGFRRLFLGQIARSRAEAIADHAILANQPDGEYASSNHEDCSIWRWIG
jgi:SAM-dependent methyltransferase